MSATIGAIVPEVIEDRGERRLVFRQDSGRPLLWAERQRLCEYLSIKLELPLDRINNFDRSSQENPGVIVQAALFTYMKVGDVLEIAQSALAKLVELGRRFTSLWTEGPSGPDYSLWEWHWRHINRNRSRTGRHMG